MIKSATAVKAKIKNKSGGNSDKSQIILRIYLMERLMERVSLSKYRDNFVLKGGLLVSSLVGVDMRSTICLSRSRKRNRLVLISFALSLECEYERRCFCIYQKEI